MATVTLAFSAIVTPSKQSRYRHSGLYILCKLVTPVHMTITQTEPEMLEKQNLIEELALL